MSCHLEICPCCRKDHLFLPHPMQPSFQLYTYLVQATASIPSLEQRRQYLKLITLFKIFNGFILMPDAPVHVRLLRILRNSQQLFSRPTARTFSFDSSFFQAPLPLGTGFHRLSGKVTLYTITSILY